MVRGLGRSCMSSTYVRYVLWALGWSSSGSFDGKPADFAVFEDKDLIPFAFNPLHSDPHYISIPSVNNDYYLAKIAKEILVLYIKSIIHKTNQKSYEVESRRGGYNCIIKN